MATNKDFIPLPINTRYSKGAEAPSERQAREADPGSDKKKAYDLVNAQYGPQRTNLVQDLTRLGRDRQYENQVQENFGERHDEKLAGISELLQNQLGQVTDRTQQAYKGASNTIQDAYGRAQQSSQGASEDVLSALQQQMQRLGLMEAGRDPNAMLQQQQTDMSGRHAISGAGATGNAEALGADMTSLAAKTQGDSAQEWGQKRDALGQQVMATVNEINREYNNARDQVMGELRAVESSRGMAMRSTLEEVIENRLERERQAKLDQLSEWATRQGIDIQRGYLNLSGQRFGLEQELGRGGLDIQRGQLDVSRGGLDIERGRLDLSRQEMELRREQLEQEIALANSPEEQRRKELELNLLESELSRMELDARMSEMNMLQGGDPGRYKGIEGIQQYFDAQQPGLGSYAVENYNQLMMEARTAAAGDTLTPDEAFWTLVSNIEDPYEKQAMMQAYYIHNNELSNFAE
jgi:hypothetical protein